MAQQTPSDSFGKLSSLKRRDTLACDPDAIVHTDQDLLEELEANWRTSLMDATIIQVNTSLGGLPKRAIPSGMISHQGLEGDRQAHPEIHGGEMQAILIIASEVIDRLVALGYPVFPGALGENLTTRGLEIRDLRIGDQLRAGGAVLEITKPRAPCRQLDVYGPTIQNEIYDKRVKERDPKSPRWGMSGFYCRVISPGPVGPGDIIAVVASLA